MMILRSLNFRIVERYAFLAVLLLNLIPVFSGKFFPSLDGPAHLYNAKLIQTLLFENHSNIQAYFTINPEPVPNWLGHALLAFFQYFLPSYMAEKLVIIIYLVGLPLAFRSLVKRIAPQNIWLSYVIFPFTYSLLFILGFYNFSLAMFFLFLTISYWIKKQDSRFSIRFCVTLFLLILASYFSHIFVFGILLFLIGIHIFFDGILTLFQSGQIRKTRMLLALKDAAVLLFCSSLPLLLFVNYLLKRPNLDQDIFFETNELIHWLKTLRPLVALNFDVEEIHTARIVSVLKWLLIFALVSSLYQVFKLRKQNRFQVRALLSELSIRRVIWFTASFFMLFLYFKMPDSDGYAGYITFRLALFFFLFGVLFLATFKIHRWIGIFAISIVLYSHFALNFFYTHEAKVRNEIVAACLEASKFIEPDSIVLPINYSGDWFLNHFSNYLGIEKPMVILENYECNYGYFPLIWNYDAMPHIMLGKESGTGLQCVELKGNWENDPQVVDYVFILGELGSKSEHCHPAIERIVVEDYALIFENLFCSLYRFKKH